MNPTLSLLEMELDTKISVGKGPAKSTRVPSRLTFRVHLLHHSTLNPIPLLIEHHRLVSGPKEASVSDLR